MTLALCLAWGYATGKVMIGCGEKSVECFILNRRLEGNGKTAGLEFSTIIPSNEDGVILAAVKLILELILGAASI